MKILVVDDHALIRDALRGVLKELKDDASVVEASDSRQALRLTDENPDVGLILLDLNLPDRSGFDLLADLRGSHPAVSVLVFSGGVYVPPEILGPREPSAKRGRAGAGARPGSPRELGLTDRQVEILALMMQGKSNKAICRSLDLAEPTVKNHVTAILKALKVTNRTEAVIAVGALGWELRSPEDS